MQTETRNYKVVGNTIYFKKCPRNFLKTKYPAVCPGHNCRFLGENKYHCLFWDVLLCNRQIGGRFIDEEMRKVTRGVCYKCYEW